MVFQYLAQRYEDKVVTHYFDVADERVRSEHPEFVNLVERHRWSLPLVTVDGKVELVGYIDHRSIINIIERKAAV